MDAAPRTHDDDVRVFSSPKGDASVNSSEVSTPFLASVKWNGEGLVPAIVQDTVTGDVLMMAWMNPFALERTLATGQTHFYSRSRRSIWHKGGTSGHVQNVESMLLDCDGDVVLVKVRQVGGACHEGYRTCFFRRVGPAGQLEVVETRVFEPSNVYSGQPEKRSDRVGREDAE
jgi:phosphoribosyl-AMP cyclohydrolase